MNINNEEQPIFVEIVPVPNKGSIKVTVGYHTLQIKEEGSSMYDFYIPAFDIFFCASSIEESKKIGQAMMDSFISFWSKNYGTSGFVQELNRLGFKTSQHNFSMFNIIKKKNISKKEKFNSLRPNIPNDFINATRINVKQEFSVAV